ncbi:MAG: L-serine ammonia-lyase, iron-sulfur-dependent, subunit alpha, partial [Gemmatimonadetes bacterium]|nr:L-serine ammonia-lyase, iron-sulfur-dependent, subunit alpha [Gemmatimonadota bacterium]
MIRSFAEWFEQAEAAGVSLAEFVERREVKETGVPREAIRKRIEDTLTVMRGAVAEGLAESATSPSGLTGGRSGRLAADGPRLLGDDFTTMLSRAIATLETNARMGLIMATPTAGAAGVVPAVLLTLAPLRGWSEERLV